MAYIAYRINTARPHARSRHVLAVHINMLMAKAYCTLITIKQLQQTSVTDDDTFPEIYDKLEQTSPEADDRT